MRAAYVVLAGLALCAVVTADCPSACSGHGDCKTNWDFCDCYTGWMGNDCSQQSCPLGLSYIDTPNGDIDGDNALDSGGFDSTNKPAKSEHALNPMYRPFGYWERHPAQLYGVSPDNNGASGTGDASAYFPVRDNEGHFYAECSNRGLCDRSTGLCQCFTGYEGTACNRTTCINGCSGHGICETLNQVTPDGLYYRLWDTDKTQVCKCDGGYFGPDCSQRKCMRNDDPLTTMTSKTGYNAGLLQANEIQYVDVRCPYGGKILGPARMTLTYTDVQFGDKYETKQFDISPASSYKTVGEIGDEILALLKALPNQVLADYDDGVDGFEKVVDVDVTQITLEHFYRIAVTFHHHLGNVPSLSASTFFKCNGGAEVHSDLENIQVEIVGDGPAFDIEYRFVMTTANTVAAVKVYNGTGAILSELASATVSHTFTATSNSVSQFIGGSSATSVETTFGREAGKVKFLYGLANTGRALNSAFRVYIHTVPEVKVRNKMFTLQPYNTGSADRAFYAKTLSARGVVTARANSVLRVVDGALGGTPAIDFALKLVTLSATLGRLYINGEIYGLVDLTAANLPDSIEDLSIGFVTAPLTSIRAGGPEAAYVAAAELDDDAGGTALAGGQTLYVNSVKLPYLDADYYDTAAGGTSPSSPAPGIPSKKYFSGGTVEDVWPTFVKYEAPEFPFTVVLQVTRVNSANDEYRWKVAGDMDWSDVEYAFSLAATPPLSAGSVVKTVTDAGSGASSASGAAPGSAPIPAHSTPSALYNMESFLTAYPDDPVRYDVQKLLLTWGRFAADNGGVDNQLRVCSTDAATYYLQIGSDGLNDSPECSDRGVCDYSSGVCKCFKGYAGIDCTTQNALSQGSSAA